MRALMIVAALALLAPTVVRAESLRLVRRIPVCCSGAAPTFGASVAVSGNDVLVGVPGQTVGAAIVFDVATGAIRAQLASAVRSREFGRAVAAAGALLVVGAPDTRAVHVFDARTFGERYVIADPNPLVPPDAAALDEFGVAVATDGAHVVVGAPFDDRRGDDAGRVYVFHAADGTLVRTLESPEPFSGARFGTAVALAGDDVVVGASAEGAGEARGTVFVFSVKSGVPRWSRTAPPEIEGLLFGFAVSVSEDRVLVGAPCRDIGEPRAGAALLLDRATGGTLRTLAAPVPETCDLFGAAVALAGDRAVVGARLAGERDTGAVHVFSAMTGAVRASFTDGAADADLGWAVATRGARVVVGAAGPDGEVRVYDRSSR